MSLQMDQLSAVMCLVVSGIGLLIFIYSKGYMHGDTGYYRFFRLHEPLCVQHA